MNNDKWIVRLYDGVDNCWVDITDPVDRDEAQRVWAINTKDGTVNTNYGDLDYYRVFPADTKMVYTYDNFGGE